MLTIPTWNPLELCRELVPAGPRQGLPDDVGAPLVLGAASGTDSATQSFGPNLCANRGCPEGGQTSGLIADGRHADVPARKRGRVLVRVAAVFATFLFCIILAVCGGIWWLAETEKQLNAPDWLKARVEQQMLTYAPTMRVSFGKIGVFLQKTGQIRFALADVHVTNDVGHSVANLHTLEGGLSGWDLLLGDTVLRGARISGAFITVLRDENGQLGLALGDAFADDVEAPDVSTMIATLDNLAENSFLSDLDLVEADAMTIRYEDARARRGWTVDGGRLVLERKDGVIHLTGDMALLGGGQMWLVWNCMRPVKSAFNPQHSVLP